MALAWTDACDYLREMTRQHGPAGRLAPEQLYSIIPGPDTMAVKELNAAQFDARLSKTIASKVRLDRHACCIAVLSGSCYSSERLRRFGQLSKNLILRCRGHMMPTQDASNRRALFLRFCLNM